ncbi:MAG: glycoside hydrolase family 16 protein [Pseudomonadota bacterium]
MSHSFLSLSLAIAALSACASTLDTDVTGGPLPASLDRPSDYNLVWSDEFSVDGLPDDAHWTYDKWRNPDGWWNDEKQYYAGPRAKNARVDNGHLIIEAHAEPTPIAQFPDTGGQTYTSARLMTQDRASWTYGYFEVRAKLPCGRGLWPAIWTLPQNRNAWPDDGEIDIMEYVGWDTNRIHATVHTKDRNHIKGNQVSATYSTDTACGAFHTHSLLWTKDEILVAIDGTPYYHYQKTRNKYGEWPFDQAHYLILNLAIGGWGGLEGIDPEAFPARMEVDYVRIYQKPDAS